MSGSLHEEPTRTKVPPSVHALDAVLNARVAEASTDEALNIALAEKLQLKRLLVDLPEHQLEAQARAVLSSRQSRTPIEVGA